ncbi:MAG: OmpA family protein [Myxococcota bacterium]
MAAILAHAAHAEGPSPGFALDTFEPQPVLGHAILGVSTARVLENAQFSFGVFGHYQDDPLTAVSFQDRSQVTARLVDARWTAEVMAAVGLFDYFELGLVMPLVVSQSGDDLGAIGRPGETVDGFALGDLRIIPKVRILGGAADGSDGFGLHLLVPIAVPTGSQDGLASDGAIRLRPTLGLDYAFSGHVIAANVGYEIRSAEELETYTSDDALRWSVGARVAVLHDMLAVLATVQGSVAIASQPVADAPTTPIEILGGLEATVGGGLVVAAGIGAPLLRGVGSPDVRAYLALGWTPGKAGPSEPDVPELPKDTDGDGLPDDKDKCKDFAEDLDGYQDEDGCPDPDNDIDGIPDEADKCPDAAEDYKGPEDGCPTVDTDNDGILDADDKCPTEAEDKDGVDDADGCPDVDSDGDGVEPDKCPDQAEDKDGFQDDDGCPDPDDDQDGILDGADKCPTMPESKNGFQDDDGCPDTTEKDIVFTGLTLEIKQSIFFAFDSDKIKEKSFPILDAIGRIMAANPFITRLSIEGHTDSEGPEDANLDLSTRRAASVRQYLIDHGIAAERLLSTGWGESRPLKPNTTPAGRAANRRVEFKVTEVNGSPVAAPHGAP